MEHAKKLISTLEQLVSTRTKRHIVAGILLSTSIFLGGLALTAISTKDKYEEDIMRDREDDYE